MGRFVFIRIRKQAVESLSHVHRCSVEKIVGRIYASVKRIAAIKKRESECDASRALMSDI